MACSLSARWQILQANTPSFPFPCFFWCLIMPRFFPDVSYFLFPHITHDSSSGRVLMRINMGSHIHLLLSFLQFFENKECLKMCLNPRVIMVTTCHREVTTNTPRFSEFISFCTQAPRGCLTSALDTTAIPTVPQHSRDRGLCCPTSVPLPISLHSIKSAPYHVLLSHVTLVIQYNHKTT